MLSDEVSQFCRGKLIHRRRDKWGDILVFDHGNHRVLTFDSNYEQSRLDKSQPALLVHYYTRAMMLGMAFIEPKHVTILGLGSGCLLQAFHDMFDETVLAVVEFRQAVVDVARKYFCLPEAPHIMITVMDAEHYLKMMTPASTDIIFADLYNADDMNSLQMQKSFLRQCHRVLTAEGWLVLNFHELPGLSSEFFSVLRSLFKEILVYHVPNENHIIYAGKCRLIGSLDAYASRTKWFPHNDRVRYDLLFTEIIRLKDYQFPVLAG